MIIMATTKKWGLIAFLAMFAVPLFAEPPTTDTARVERWKSRGKDSPADGPRSRPSHHDRDKDDHNDGKSFHSRHRRYNPEEFRKLLKEELQHIPTLNKPMGRLMEIQAERYTLQNERRNVKIDEDKDRSKVVGKFHELLKRDMQLGEESRKIVHNINRDMGGIQKEIATRKDFLRKSLQEENTRPENAETSSSKAEGLYRSQRCLDFLDRKLKDLESRPERMDLLSRMLRGIPMDDPPPPSAFSHKDHSPADMDDLQARKRHLQRQLKEVEEDIQEQREKDDKKQP